MSQSKPDVSVLTPSFGYGRFLGDAIDSVLLQTDMAVEHIIQDGGSKDETSDVVHQRSSDSRLLFVSEQDDGQSDALNRALEKANGTWIAWLNADEFYLPGSLGDLVRFANKVRADVVYGDSLFVDEEGRFVRLLPQHDFSARLLRWYGAYIASCALLVRRDKLGTLPWSPKLRKVMDWDLYCRLHSRGLRFAHLSAPVAAFRLHDAQVTSPLRTETFGDEYRHMRDVHGVITAAPLRRIGRLVHGSKKLLGDAYRLQRLGRQFRGNSFVWMNSLEEMKRVQDFKEMVYGSTRGR